MSVICSPKSDLGLVAKSGTPSTIEASKAEPEYGKLVSIGYFIWLSSSLLSTFKLASLWLRISRIFSSSILRSCKIFNNSFAPLTDAK